MKFNLGNIRIYVEANYEAMSKKAAYILSSQIRLEPQSVIGLATGGTPVGMYKELVRMHNEEDLDFSEITTFNLDEYYPIAKDNPQSYYYYMMENLFNHVNIDLSRVHIPNGMAQDVAKECENYETMIRNAGRISLQVLGIGPNGHIGFNEPDAQLEPYTHLVDLDEKTIEANSRYFNSREEVPKQALSMGVKTIMSAKKLMLLASGQNKAEIIKESIMGGITPEIPASFLQLHPDVTIILDKEAASEILPLL
ncbi:MAG: glucosamine-6-phosphate deaminase [Defluviitaleaceae bacterium]|jgi:glucosamine-6-phosphate deaminase|nr:glucosamine-6-phosphate deaminase [Defluviitaleaceae bacterium]